jgi:nitroreductase
MTTRSAPGVATLRALIARATLAPSPHNVQPWRWTLHADHAELELDSAAAELLAQGDPDARELVMSCGAALLTLRVAAAEALFDARVDLLPDPHRSTLLADVTLVGGAVDAAFSTLDAVVPLRRTAWGAFDDRPLPAGLAQRLRVEAMAEAVQLVEVGRADRGPLSDLLQEADLERFRADHRTVPADRLTAAREAEMLVEAPYVAVLGTDGDGVADWLAAGQGLQRVLLVAAADGVLGGFLNAPCQVEAERARLRALLPAMRWPQIVLRLGYPVERPAASARRPVDEVVVVQDGPVPARHPHGAPETPLEAGVGFSEDTLG